MASIIYNQLKVKKDNSSDWLQETKLVSLPMLRTNPECRMEAQIVHVKKCDRIKMYMRGSDKSKKFGKSYDRLIFLRDTISGLGFAIIADSPSDSVIMFHKKVKIGDYVQLYLPDYDIHEVAEVPLVGYRDVLMPLKKLSYNKMVSSIPMGVNFAVFAVQLKDPKEFKIYGLGVDKVCGGTLCDGLMDDPCPCLSGTGLEKYAITFKMKVPISGIEECYTRFRSLKFTNIFFGPKVMNNLNLCDLMEIENVLKEGLSKVKEIMIAGWAGYAVDEDDDISSAVKFHVTSCELQCGNGDPVTPNDTVSFDSCGTEDDTEDDDSEEDKNDDNNDNNNVEETNDVTENIEMKEEVTENIENNYVDERIENNDVQHQENYGWKEVTDEFWN